MPRRISFLYRNHRGQVAERTIDVQVLQWIEKPGYDYQPGWFITGIDLDKGALRSFALSHVVLEEHRLRLLTL